ncbi:hypothetical protein O3P69_002207 [Scylla paramamosain]|uniref:Uncharacterized protein n=1 Tax=Scylla paramamosain TaxID=85552 RepID=A0AAW0V8C2_SCYPA
MSPVSDAIMAAYYLKKAELLEWRCIFLDVRVQETRQGHALDLVSRYTGTQVGRKARQGKTRRGKARQGKSRRGKAGRAKARQGKARQGKARQGKPWQGKATQDKARQGRARQGKARQGEARQSKARQGKARQGKARKGKARQAKGPRHPHHSEAQRNTPVTGQCITPLEAQLCHPFEAVQGGVQYTHTMQHPTNLPTEIQAAFSVPNIEKTERVTATLTEALRVSGGLNGRT